MIRSDEVARSAPAKHQRARTARWRGLTVGVASLTAMLGTALVPGLGVTPAGATGNTVTVVTGHSGGSAPSLGVGVPKASAKISPIYVAYNASNGDTAVASTQAGSVYVYLIAGGGSGSEANEYHIQTAPNPAPAFGSLTSGDAYIVAGTGTAGLIAQPGNNQFGNSTTAVATANPIEPTSVAFDPNGNLLIAGENSAGDSAIQVVAKTTGTFYGVSMTAGDLYTIADVGLSGSPSTAINMGDVAAPANGMSVDPSGNIVVGNGDGVDFVNEQTSGSLTLYGQSIPAQSSAVIAGTAEGGTDCAPGATSDSASSQYFQSPEPFVDSSDNVYFSDNEPGPDSGCDWVLPAQSGTLDGLSVTAGNVYKLAGNGGTTATPDGTAGVDANVAGISEMTLDTAGNVVLAVSGASGTGNSPALQVLAETTGTFYGVSMTAGDIYTIAGGSSNLLATLSGPTSILNAGGGDLLFTDGSASSANLDEFSGGPTSAPGGTVSVYKTTALIGNYGDKVSGTDWAGETTVSLNQCATTTYSAATCDAANKVSGVALGTGRAAGIFKSAVIDLAVGVIDSNGDTCGVANSTPCYVVVVGNTGDSTASGVLGFSLPSFTAKKTTDVLGNYVDSVKPVNFPIGDTVVAQECDASVSAPSNVATNCDSATQITGTSGMSGKVTFSSSGVTLGVGSAYSDTAAGTCEQGGSCAIGVTDSNNSAIGVSLAVGFASGPTASLKETTNVLGNYTDVVKAAGFPIGDTVVAQECDSNLVFPTTESSNCDSATQISGTAGAKGTVTFSSTGVKLLIGGDYSDSAHFACAAGGTCQVLVSDSANPGIGTSVDVTFAVPAVTLKETSNVEPNYVDKVTATEFPVGDTVTAQECDGTVTSANMATHCDSATQITGTVQPSGGVLLSPTGVTVKVGSSYTDSFGGTCPAGGSCDIVVNDSSDSGFYIATPVGLAP